MRTVVLICCSLQVMLVTVPLAADQALDQLLKRIDHSREVHHVAGIGLTIVHGDSVVYAGGLGVEDWQTKKPVTAQTLFRLGSVTKSFVGLTALRMARDKPALLTISVDQVLGDILTDPFDQPPVTLQNLLEHTAGLTDLSRAEFDFQGEFVTFEDAVKIAPATRVLKWPAHQHSSYSNAGYGLAGYVLETVGGTPFEDLVGEFVLKPLSMKNSGFYRAAPLPSLATGYDSDGVTPIPYWHMLYRSFGGLNSTPDDMSHWLRALVASDKEGHDKVFLTTIERRRFENPATTLAASTGLGYGYGLGNYHWYRKGLRFHGHGGDADGYLSRYGYNHDTGMAYFIVINAFRHAPLKEMRLLIEDYIAAKSNSVATSAVTLEPAQLKQWLGEYRQATHRFSRTTQHDGVLSVELNKKGNGLVTRYQDNTSELLAVNAKHFRRRWQPAASCAFIVDANGDTFFQSDLGNFQKIRTRQR